MQSVVGSAKVKHLAACNKILQHAISTADRGLVYKSDAFNFDESILVTVSDASWANETKLCAPIRIGTRETHTGGTHTSLSLVPNASGHGT